MQNYNITKEGLTAVFHTDEGTKFLKLSGFSLSCFVNDNIIEFKVGQEKEDVPDKVETMIGELLRKIGIPANIKGYTYLRTAIRMTVMNESVIGSVTKVLYPDVAKQYKTNALCVEHAIRRAIEIAWERGDNKTRQKYFGTVEMGRKRKPTNSEFIATIADVIRKM